MRIFCSECGIRTNHFRKIGMDGRIRYCCTKCVEVTPAIKAKEKPRVAAHLGTLEQWVRHHPEEAKALKAELKKTIDRVFASSEDIIESPPWEEK